MIFRKATSDDFEEVKRVFGEAVEYFKSNNIDQWQKGYPSEDTLKADIESGHMYLVIDEGQVCASFVCMKDKDPSYESITNGWWSKDEDYILLSKIAVDNDHRRLGIGDMIIEYVEKTFCPDGYGYIKSDTHIDNVSMHNLLIKHGFREAGVIKIKEGSDAGSRRVAYDKVLRPEL